MSPQPLRLYGHMAALVAFLPEEYRFPSKRPDVKLNLNAVKLRSLPFSDIQSAKKEAVNG